MAYVYQEDIGGSWVGATNSGTWDVLNPANEEVIRQVPSGP
jgi:acyl-CoA reductase-like NAD-dependent aldehyde dehydrogenase